MHKLRINGRTQPVIASPETPVLWVLRDELDMTGTRFGCGLGLCGACTIHLNGEAVRSCCISVSAVENNEITTVEAMGASDIGREIQKAWLEHEVPQCGYCQSGQMMSAMALLMKNSQPSDQDIDHAMNGNICRCGTYIQIREAIHAAAAALRKS
ncbi:(2Fe-2S)-binding protein [Caballeronia udeis]|uniref:(2Fe-2S)-binding protein n=1 Tax=Caballeronia udeis TaxID=1232866 RepID=UPI00384E1F4F